MDPLSPSQCWTEKIYRETCDESTFILQHLALTHFSSTFNIVVGGWGLRRDAHFETHVYFADTGTLKIRKRIKWNRDELEKKNNLVTHWDPIENKISHLCLHLLQRANFIWRQPASAVKHIGISYVSLPPTISICSTPQPESTAQGTFWLSQQANSCTGQKNALGNVVFASSCQNHHVLL